MSEISPSERSVVGVVEEVVKQKLVTLIVPSLVLDESRRRMDLPCATTQELILQDGQVVWSGLTIAKVTALDLMTCRRAANETCPIRWRDEPGRVYRRP